MSAIETPTKTETDEERIVREEQERFDAEQQALADEAGQTKAFDDADYEREDLALPKVDGHGVDKIAIAFKGRILLDRSNPDHISLFRQLALGKTCDLRVSGEVVRTATGRTTNREGDLDAIVGERTVHIDTVYVLAPEEL